MTPQEIQAELQECLRLQDEVERKRQELTLRFKQIVEAARNSRQPIITEIDGVIYQLGTTDSADEVHEAMDSARKHGGFFLKYRLIKFGKPVRK